MHCEYCGNYVESSDKKCPSCGARLDHSENQLPVETVDEDSDSREDNVEYMYSSVNTLDIKNYLVLSILCTIIFVSPLGIPAIVFGVQVNRKLKSGDVGGAKTASKKAKTWLWISFITGIVVYYLIGTL